MNSRKTRDISSNYSSYANKGGLGPPLISPIFINYEASKIYSDCYFSYFNPSDGCYSILFQKLNAQYGQKKKVISDIPEGLIEINISTLSKGFDCSFNKLVNLLNLVFRFLYCLVLQFIPLLKRDELLVLIPGVGYIYLPVYKCV